MTKLTEDEKGITAVMSLAGIIVTACALSFAIGHFFGVGWGWLTFAVIAAFFSGICVWMVCKKEKPTDDD